MAGGIESESNPLHFTVAQNQIVETYGKKWQEA
jgi:hypothetical protein